MHKARRDVLAKLMVQLDVMHKRLDGIRYDEQDYFERISEFSRADERTIASKKALLALKLATVCVGLARTALGRIGADNNNAPEREPSSPASRVIQPNGHNVQYLAMRREGPSNGL